MVRTTACGRGARKAPKNQNLSLHHRVEQYEPKKALQNRINNFKEPKSELPPITHTYVIMRCPVADSKTLALMNNARCECPIRSADDSCKHIDCKEMSHYWHKRFSRGEPYVNMGCCFAQDAAQKVKQLERVMKKQQQKYDVLVSNCPDAEYIAKKHEFCGLNRKAIKDACNKLEY